MLVFFLLLNTLLIFYCIYKDRSDIPYKINSPIVVSLYGVFLFYVMPLFYWLNNEWPFNMPSYTEGSLDVQICIFLFLMPLIFFPRNIIFNINIYKIKYNRKSLLSLIIIILGVILNAYYETFILGNQGRFEFQSYDSSSFSYLLTSLFHDYGLCFILCLYLSDKKNIIKFANISLLLYFIPTLLSFHRFAILIFFFQLFIFFILIKKINIKPLKLLTYSIFGLIFIIGFIGRFGIEGIVYLSNHNTSAGSLSISDIVTITKNVFINFSFTTTIKPSIWDEMFLRLNQSRSAAAVIHNFSTQSSFYLGFTFLSVFFFFIPRYIYPNKPDMSSTHLITVDFMGTDFGGVNPLGSIAEVYINFGFYGIIPISILFHLFFIFLIRIFVYFKDKLLLFVAFYPYFAFMFFAFDLNLSQRIVQLSKATFFLILISFFIKGKKQNCINNYSHI